MASQRRAAHQRAEHAIGLRSAIVTVADLPAGAPAQDHRHRLPAPGKAAETRARRQLPWVEHFQMGALCALEWEPEPSVFCVACWRISNGVPSDLRACVQESLGLAQNFAISCVRLCLSLWLRDVHSSLSLG